MKTKTDWLNANYGEFDRMVRYQCTKRLSNVSRWRSLQRWIDNRKRLSRAKLMEAEATLIDLDSYRGHFR